MSLKAFVESRWYANSPGILWLLLPLEGIFRVLVQWRKRRIFSELKNTQRPVVKAETPLVVVGNLSVGGTGKTPVVIALAQSLKIRGKRVGIVSRGYGRDSHEAQLVTALCSASDVGDEPLEIALATGCPVAVASDRRQAVALLKMHHTLDLILSDDGLQHYSMRRVLEVAVFSRMLGVGNGHCLPVGPLREPLSRLADVDFVLWTGDEPSTVVRPSISHPAIFSSRLRFHCWVNIHSGEQKPIDFSFDTPLVAIAGIGQPENFFSTLRRFDLKCECIAKADHAAFSADDFLHNERTTYLMTAKDAVKCQKIAPESSWYLKVSAELEPMFEQAFYEKIFH